MKFLNVGTVVHYVTEGGGCAAAIVLQAMKHEDGHFCYWVRVQGPMTTFEQDECLYDEKGKTVGMIHEFTPGLIEEASHGLKIVPPESVMSDEDFADEDK